MNALSMRTEAIDPAGPRMCVLASGSSGNCSVLAFGPPNRARLTLIDLGLGPRKTGALLRDLGCRLDQVTDVLLTHLDHDHCKRAWVGALPARATLRIHRRHRSRAQRTGFLHRRRTEVFDDEAFEVPNVGTVAPIHMAHDQTGVAAFRFDLGGHHLGYATDLGRVTDRLVEHMAGVDTLAIESNYCPRLQMASGRPMFLKKRVMGGAGHLSNPECVDAARAIAPTQRTVLLHLSRQCNTPELAMAGHADAPYGLTVTSQFEPTGWMPLNPARPARARAVVEPQVQMGLFVAGDQALKASGPV